MAPNQEEEPKVAPNQKVIEPEVDPNQEEELKVAPNQDQFIDDDDDFWMPQEEEPEDDLVPQKLKRKRQGKQVVVTEDNLVPDSDTDFSGSESSGKRLLDDIIFDENIDGEVKSVGLKLADEIGENEDELEQSEDGSIEELIDEEDLNSTDEDVEGEKHSG